MCLDCPNIPAKCKPHYAMHFVLRKNELLYITKGHLNLFTSGTSHSCTFTHPCHIRVANKSRAGDFARSQKSRGIRGIADLKRNLWNPKKKKLIKNKKHYCLLALFCPFCCPHTVLIVLCLFYCPFTAWILSFFFSSPNKLCPFHIILAARVFVVPKLRLASWATYLTFQTTLI